MIRLPIDRELRGLEGEVYPAGERGYVIVVRESSTQLLLHAHDTAYVDLDEIAIALVEANEERKRIEASRRARSRRRGTVSS